MTQLPTTAAKDRLSIRDLITIGLLSLLLKLVITIVPLALYLYPPTFPFGVAVAAIPGGIIGMLLLARTSKPGTILVWGGALALVMLVMGYGLIPPAIVVAATIPSELLWRALGRSRFVAMAAGYSSLIAGLTVGFYAPYAFLREKTMADSLAIGSDPAALAAAIRLVTPGTVPILAVIAFGGAWLGAVWGRRVLRKHFERAGKV